MTHKNFIDLNTLDKSALRSILDRSHAAKRARAGWPKGRQDADKPLEGYLLAMIFEKPSTRTRVSFDVGMRQLGGETLLLNGGEMQLGRGETVADTARVLSRYVDIIMLRTDDHAKMQELAEHASVPVINGLSDDGHPCQLMADVMTFEEHRGPITGKRVAWIGDGNNMARSWIEATHRFDFELMLACPPELAPPAQCIEDAIAAGGKVRLVNDAHEAAKNVDAIVTDTWVSMGDKEAERRHNLLAPYQVTASVIGVANDDAIFMHCLPAHRGEEVTTDVIDGPQSVIFDEAENRLHAQKGILAWCLD
ncbi:Ornithine carbamoyltransferase [Candidatus Phaeomarinobacter ectocarpi]|uniref:Ornithine carbamoyltransferase n=1 Tax=Candidatus Phaeomarinibacter ectocarpi TaxID=1458461 RepID=X5M9D3_9HYPH|nr:ornithine carbamoyltransferase [Candidatus Phaeomarinobacter ectocarpi]CDO60118.1 Ornithine carbamoyltransferase [Candidatus Phaeomarinobacter ectocarpi]